MENRTRLETVRKIVLWLLVIVAVVYIVSGFGITEFRTVGALTFGLLGKDLSFKIHNALTIPGLVILGLHIAVGLASHRTAKR